MGKFRRGQRVRIIGPERNGLNDGLLGLFGTVDGPGCRRGITAVRVTNVTNFRSSYGVFYFPDSSLELANEEPTNTNKEDFIMKDFTSVVTVSSMHGPWVEKKCACYGLDLKENDTCVVHVPGAGLLVGTVEAVHAPETVEEPLTAEVVDKVDETAFKARVEQRKLEKELKAKMAERAKKLQDIVLYETLAKSDPEMQQLLDQYKTLNGF